MNPKKNENEKEPNGKKPRNIWLALVITIAIVLVISMAYNTLSRSQYREVDYNDFATAMENGDLVEVELQYDRIVFLTREDAEKPATQRKACFTGLPQGGDMLALADKLTAQGVKVNQLIVEDNSTIIMILFYAGMFLVTFLLMRSVTKRMSGGGMMGGPGQMQGGMPGGMGGPGGQSGMGGMPGGGHP